MDDAATGPVTSVTSEASDLAPFAGLPDGLSAGLSAARDIGLGVVTHLVGAQIRAVGRRIALVAVVIGVIGIVAAIVLASSWLQWLLALLFLGPIAFGLGTFVLSRVAARVVHRVATPRLVRRLGRKEVIDALQRAGIPTTAMGGVGLAWRLLRRRDETVAQLRTAVPNLRELIDEAVPPT